MIIIRVESTLRRGGGTTQRGVNPRHKQKKRKSRRHKHGSTAVLGTTGVVEQESLKPYEVATIKTKRQGQPQKRLGQQGQQAEKKE